MGKWTEQKVIRNTNKYMKKFNILSHKENACQYTLRCHLIKKMCINTHWDFISPKSEWKSWGKWSTTNACMDVGKRNHSVLIWEWDTTAMEINIEIHQ
jgi:hypothetical protein